MEVRLLFEKKPIIGIAGGIGSGKTFIAGLFAERGCCVIHSDEQVHQVYEQIDVKDTLRSWWGPGVIDASGRVDRGFIARHFLGHADERIRLEALLHPRVADMRRAIMNAAAGNPQVPAFVWDAPLLFEAGLHEQCDAVVFVACPRPVRLARVAQARGWAEPELARRENLQWPLDKKRSIAEYVVDNTADADYLREQVKTLLSRICERWA